MKKTVLFMLFATSVLAFGRAEACTGITLRTNKGQTITARTIEWAYTPLNGMYTVVPRGYTQRSFLPDGLKEGMEFTSRYGYAGVAVEQAEFVMEGINEAGLSAGLFYFPDYGEYEDYDKTKKNKTISDFQLVSWILANFKTVDEVKAAMKNIRVVSIDRRSSTVHWRVIDESGRQIVMEIVGKQVLFHENELGVLTNSPSFDWHLKNLNNYINLFAGSAESKKMNGVTLHAFGAGSGLLGIPGDMTPPSRFIRAAFFQTNAPLLASNEETVFQAFHILNNFDIPIGVQFSNKEEIPPMASATQFTIASDLSNRRIYYRTVYNSDLRCIDLKAIRFDKVKFKAEPLDEARTQSVKNIVVK